jgi:hypothetical protein
MHGRDYLLMEFLKNHDGSKITVSNDHWTGCVNGNDEGCGRCGIVMVF